MKNRRMEIQIRKMREKEAEESHYTGKPIINRSHKQSDSNENRFERLYKEAERKRNNIKELVDEDTEKEFTYQPQSFTKTHRSTSAGRARIVRRDENASPNPSPVPQVGDNPLQVGDGGMNENNGRPFTPTISKKAQKLTRDVDQYTGQKIDVGEMLYSQGKVLSEKLRKLKDSIQKKEHEDNTFKPKFSTRKKDATNVTTKFDDLTERMERYQEFKNRRLENVKKQKEESDEKNWTFRPALVTTTKRYSTPTDPIHKRLQVFAENKKAIVEEVKKEMTVEEIFQPDFSFKKRPQSPDKKSDKRPKTPEVVRVPVSVDHEASGERMFKAAEIKRYENDLKHKALKEENEMDGSTFAPNLVARSRSKSASRATRAQRPASEEPGERMYYEGKARMDKNLQKREEKKVEREFTECSFHPQISKKGQRQVHTIHTMQTIHTIHTIHTINTIYPIYTVAAGGRGNRGGYL